MSELIYGIHPVLESIRAGKRRIESIIIAKESPEHKEIIKLAREKNIPVQKKSLQDLGNLVPGAKHQGVLAKSRELPTLDLGDLIDQSYKRGEEPFLILADCVQDPHNLGAIIRTAEAAGCHGLIISARHSVGLTSTVAKSAAGAMEFLPISIVNNSADAIQKLKNSGFWMVGLDPEGESRYDQLDLKRPIAIIIGGEGVGLRKSLHKHCDHLAYLPQSGKINSLNTSVAAALMLYEVRRQRNN